MKKNDGCGQSVPISFTLLLRIMKLGLIFFGCFEFFFICNHPGSRETGFLEYGKC